MLLRDMGAQVVPNRSMSEHPGGRRGGGGYLQQSSRNRGKAGIADVSTETFASPSLRSLDNNHRATEQNSSSTCCLCKCSCTSCSACEA